MFGEKYSFVGPCADSSVSFRFRNPPTVVDAKRKLGEEYHQPGQNFEIYYCGTRLDDLEYLLVSEYTYEYRLKSNERFYSRVKEYKGKGDFTLVLYQWSTVRDAKIALEEKLGRKNIRTLIIIKDKDNTTLPDWYRMRSRDFRYKILPEGEQVTIKTDFYGHQIRAYPRSTVKDFISSMKSTMTPVVCNAQGVILPDNETLGQYKGRMLHLKYAPKDIQIGPYKYSSSRKCADFPHGKLIYKGKWEIPDYITFAHLNPRDIAILATREIVVNDSNGEFVPLSVASTDTVGMVIQRMEELTQRRVIYYSDASGKQVNRKDNVFVLGSLTLVYASEEDAREFTVVLERKPRKVQMKDKETMMDLIVRCNGNPKATTLYINKTEVPSERFQTLKFWAIPDNSQISMTCEYSVVLIAKDKKTYTTVFNTVHDLKVRAGARGGEVWTVDSPVRDTIPAGTDTLYLVNPKETTNIVIQRGETVERKTVKFTDTIGSCLRRGEEMQVGTNILDQNHCFFSILFWDSESVFVVKPEAPCTVNFKIGDTVCNVLTHLSITTRELQDKIGDYFGVQGCSIGSDKSGEILWDTFSKHGIVDVNTRKSPTVQVVMKKGNNSEEMLKFDLKETIGGLRSSLRTRGILNPTIFFGDEQLEDTTQICSLVFDLSSSITVHCPVMRTTSNKKLDIRIVPTKTKPIDTPTCPVVEDVEVTFVCSENSVMKPFSVMAHSEATLVEIMDILKAELPDGREFKLANATGGRRLKDIMVDGQILYDVKTEYTLSGLHTLESETVSLFGNEEVSYLRKRVKRYLKTISDLKCDLSMVGLKRPNSYELLPDDMKLKDVNWGKARRRELVPAITYGFLRRGISRYAIELNDTVGNVKGELEVAFGLDEEIFALSYFSVVLRDDMYLYSLPEIQDNPIRVHITETETRAVRFSYNGTTASFDILPGCCYDDIESMGRYYFDCSDLFVVEDGIVVTGGELDPDKDVFEFVGAPLLRNITGPLVSESIDLAAPMEEPDIAGENLAEDLIEYKFKCQGEFFTMSLPVSATAAQCREMVAERYRCHPDTITFLYGGKALHNVMVLSELQIKPGQHIIVYIRDMGAILIRSALALAV